MERKTAIALLTEHQDELKKLGVKCLSIFGSVARNEAREDSDVDILVEWEEGKESYFAELVELYNRLESILGREVDIASPKNLKRYWMRMRVFNDAVCVFPQANCKIYQKEVVGKVPPRSWKDRILDILEAVEMINSYIEGVNYEVFLTNNMLKDAVIRQLTIIGEAARYTPPEVESAYPEIPWQQMRGLRNVLVHEYNQVDLSKIWEISQNYLIPVESQLRELVKDDQSEA